MPALGVAWHYPRDSPETLVYNPARPMEQQQQTVAQLRRTQEEERSRFDDRMRQAEEQRRQMKQEFHRLCHKHWQSIHEAAASAQHILQSVQERRRMVHTTTAYSRTGKVGPLVLTASNVFAPEQEYAMAEQKCPTCHEKGMENRLSMSRGQQLRDSPWFYVVYCKACGHVDGVFAQDVFTTKPRASFSIPISLSSRSCPSSLRIIPLAPKSAKMAP
jgi:hypothetical protein